MSITTRRWQPHLRQQIMTPNRLVYTFLFALASFCVLSSCSIINAVEASDVDGPDCPGPDEAFVTSCSGSGSETTEDFEEDLVVDEVIEDSKGKKDSHTAPKSAGRNDDNNFERDFNIGEEDELDDDDDDTTEGSDSAPSMQQLKQTTKQLIHRYYDPLPRQGKCAIGTICGFAASRLSLGVANRAFRLAGATWVLSETMHASGFCDEDKCIPEEARPWIGILREKLVRQSARVRRIARRIWDQDRIREIAQRDEVVAGGFAAGAFVGFVV